MATLPAVITYEDMHESSMESNKRGRMDTDQDYQETLITVPPDGGWGWVVVCGAFFSFLIVDGMFYSFGVFLEKMSQDLKCSKSKVALCTAIVSGVFCLSGKSSFSCIFIKISGCLNLFFQIIIRSFIVLSNIITIFQVKAYSHFLNEMIQRIVLLELSY